MPGTCPATPAGLGSVRSRRRASSCRHGLRSLAGAKTADGHRRLRTERPLHCSRVFVRAALSC
jgi:hypothetical protein